MIANQTTANIIVFNNRTITLGMGCLGHVGWGFLVSPNLFSYGSKETTQDFFRGRIVGIIEKGAPNGVRMAKASLPALLTAIRLGGKGEPHGPNFEYHYYKLLHSPKHNAMDAQGFANWTPHSGYGLVGNNCMDDVYEIISRYAMDRNFLPWPSTHITPNSFFDAIEGPAHCMTPPQ